jgi:atypical dual specificity phosphatase
MRLSWILPQELAVGSFPKNAASAAKLQAMGVTAILCLNEEAELAVPAEVSSQFLWHRIAIPDGYTGGIPDPDHFAAALEILTAWRQTGQIMYVHCMAGIGRSPSVCAAYLVHQKRLPLPEAIQFVKNCHAVADPDPYQIRVMQKFFDAQNSGN